MNQVQNSIFYQGAFKIFKRNWRVFKKNKSQNLIWMVVEPLVIFLAIGYGVGSFIPDIQGMAYADYFFISILFISSTVVAFFEASYGTFAKMSNEGFYNSLLTTSLNTSQIALGEIFWATLKGFLSALGIALVGAMMGHISTIKFLFIPLILLTSTYFFATLGFYFSLTVRNMESLMIPTSLLIVPITLVSNTYFSLDQVPFGAKYFTFLSPLTHAVNLAREVLSPSNFDEVFLVHLLVLLVLVKFLTSIVLKKFNRHLIK
jgi:lipooligosaccharide transport system permease protein